MHPDGISSLAFVWSRAAALDLVDTEQALISKPLRHFGQVRDIAGQVEQAAALVADKVADLAGQLLAPHVQGLDGVLVTGGGTPLVLPTLQRHWPHARRLAALAGRITRGRG
jgi:hypothetical protein